MTKYMIKRILIAIPVLIGITVIDYAIMCLAGSPLEMLQGPRVSEAAVQAKEIALGLNQPFYVQYFVWLKQLLQGNMGFSMKSYQPVSEMIASHLGPTLLLMGVSLLVSLLMAVPAGIYSAVKQYSAGDYAVVTASFLSSSIPGFFLSLLLIYVFTVKLGWLPSGVVIMPEYLRLWLAQKSIQDRVLDLESGTAQKAVKIKTILNLDIFIPPLEVQKKAVMIDTLSRRRECLYRALIEEERTLTENLLENIIGGINR